MVSRRHSATPFSFPVFIFFVSCHVLVASGSAVFQSDDRYSYLSGQQLRSNQRLHKRQALQSQRHQLHVASIDQSSQKQLYPIFIEEPASQIVGVAKSVSLNCSYVSRYKVNVKWLINGSILSSIRLDKLGIRITAVGEKISEADADEDDDDYDDEDEDDDDDDNGDGESDKLGLKGANGDVDRGLEETSAGDERSSSNRHFGGSQNERSDYYNYDRHYTNNPAGYIRPDDGVVGGGEDDDDDDGGDDHDIGGGDNYMKFSRRHHIADDNPVEDSQDGKLDPYSTEGLKRRDKSSLGRLENSQSNRNLQKRSSVSDRSNQQQQQHVIAQGFQKPRSLIYKSGEILYISTFVPGFHDGLYQCLLETEEVGSILSKEAKVEAASMGIFETIQSKTSQVNAFYGGSVVIPCYPPLSKPEAVIEFRVNGSKLNLTDRHLVLPSGNLQISNLTFADSAVYQCFASNLVSNVETEASVLQTLNVVASNGPQPVIYSSQGQEFATAILGQNLTLECLAQGWPHPKITWEKYGGHLPKDRSRLLLDNLVIVRVKSLDVGTYLCKASNGVGNEPRDKVFSVEVLEPPTVVVSPSIVEATMGKSATISCNAEGAPRPTIQWLHNGMPVKDNVGKVSNLVLNNVNEHHTGTYQCVGKNSLGQEQGFARLLVVKSEVKVTSGEDEEEAGKLGDPSKDEKLDHEVTGEQFIPSKPEVTKTSNSSVKLRWTYDGPSHHHPAVPPSSGTENINPSPPYPSTSAFRIQYKEVSEGTTTSWRTVPDEIEASRRSFDVRKLRPGGTYRFRVVVVLSNGDNKHGPNSVKVVMATKAQLPVPMVVELKAVGSNKMLVVWQIHSDSWLIDGFVVSYVPNDQDFNEALTKQINRPEAREIVLNDLEPSTQYKVRVYCYNSVAGKSTPSSTVVRKTPANDWDLKPPTQEIQKPQRYSSPLPQPWDEKYEKFPTYRNTGSFSRDVELNNNNNNHDYAGTGSIIGGSSLASQSNLVYIILGTLLSLAILVTLACLVSCIIKRRRHEFSEKEKEKLKEKGIERLKQSSSLTATSPLLICSDSQRAIASSYPKSKSQSTIAGQSFPSQSGICHQNYQIKPKPTYTGSALIGGIDNTGQTDSPFHLNVNQRNPQGYVQTQVLRPQNHVEDRQHDRQSLTINHLQQEHHQQEDQSHIYSTLEEPAVNSQHSSCSSSKTYPTFYPAEAPRDRPTVAPDHHQQYHQESQRVPRLQDKFHKNISMNQSRSVGGAVMWHPAENIIPDNHTREQATNTVNTYYDNAPSEENGLNEWTENAYSSLEGLSPAMNHDQCGHDFSTNGSVSRSAGSSGDCSSLASGYNAERSGPSAAPRYPSNQRDEPNMQYPVSMGQPQQHSFSYRQEASTTPVLPSKHARDRSGCFARSDNFNHSIGDTQCDGQTRHHYQYAIDRTK